MNYAQLKSGEVSGSGGTLTLDAQFIIRVCHSRLHISFLLGGRPDWAALRQNLLAVVWGFSEENTVKWMSAVGRNLFIPPQVDDICSSAEMVFENNFWDFFLWLRIWDVGYKYKNIFLQNIYRWFQKDVTYKRTYCYISDWLNLFLNSIIMFLDT